MGAMQCLFPFVWCGARVLFWTLFVLAAMMIVFLFLAEILKHLGLEEEAGRASSVALRWFAAILKTVHLVVSAVFNIFRAPLCAHGE